MTTRHESVLAVLHGALNDRLMPKVTRDQTFSAAIPPEGLADLTADDPALVDRRLSPDVREWSRDAVISIAVSGNTPDARRAAIESRLIEVGQALVDPTLGGAVDFADLGGPEDVTDSALDGASHARAVAVTITLYYETSANSLEGA